MPDSELEEFKTRINLSAFAASRGYALQQQVSSLERAVMLNQYRDKIMIVRDEATDLWIYSNLLPNLHDFDKGTIIDFLQNRNGDSLGLIRRKLRSWLEAPQLMHNELPLFASDLVPVSRDRAAVLAETAMGCRKEGSWSRSFKKEKLEDKSNKHKVASK